MLDKVEGRLKRFGKHFLDIMQPRPTPEELREAQEIAEKGVGQRLLEDHDLTNMPN